MIHKSKSSELAKLSVFDTIGIIIGIVIGVGIYETSPLIFQNVSSPQMGIILWGIGGLISLLGALCYAELASTYPRSGGDYVYLTKAFGPGAGFLFGWAQLFVIMTGSIGMAAYIFADYASQIWPMSSSLKALSAIFLVLFLSLINIMGLQFGKRAQNTFALLSILGLFGIFVAGLSSPFLSSSIEFQKPLERSPSGGISIGVAFILILYTYGGWSDAAFVTSELRDPKKNIPRALILGILIVSIVYILTNIAYLVGLGFDGLRDSSAVAAELLSKTFGNWGRIIMSALVMITALGSVNGLIITGSRIFESWGHDHSIFPHTHRSKALIFSIGTQAFVGSLLIALVGTNSGRAMINKIFSSFKWTELNWSGRGGFDILLQSTAPIFWIFFFMTGISVFVLRYKDKETERKFEIPFYPLPPLVFCATCLYMIYTSSLYAGKLLIIGLTPLSLGVLFYSLRTIK